MSKDSTSPFSARSCWFRSVSSIPPESYPGFLRLICVSECVLLPLASLGKNFFVYHNSFSLSLVIFQFSVSISQLAIDNWIKYKQKPTQGQPEDKPWEARTVLMKVQNQLQRDVELSMQTVVSCLAGYPERYGSHTPATLCFKPFIDCIDADDQARGHVEILRPEDSRHGTPATESFSVQGHGKHVTLSNLRLDYALRPDGLDNSRCTTFGCAGRSANCHARQADRRCRPTGAQTRSTRKSTRPSNPIQRRAKCRTRELALSYLSLP